MTTQTILALLNTAFAVSLEAVQLAVSDTDLYYLPVRGDCRATGSPLASELHRILVADGFAAETLEALENHFNANGAGEENVTETFLGFVAERVGMGWNWN